MDDGTPTLEVGFAIDTGGSFDEIKRLQQLMDSAEARIVADAKTIERATGSMVNLGGATAQISSFGNAASRDLQSVARETARAEKAAEAMVRQLQRQAETYGMTASQVRAFRAEQKAVEAESRGLTEVAARLRAASAAMGRLEAGTGGVTGAATKNRMAMQGASYQVQDFITQVSMGANPINAFAVQGAQLAGQFSMVEGKAGAAARFFMGPWGLAITAGMMLFAPFVAKLFEGNNALDDAVDKLKKDAKETEATARAKDIFRLSQEGVNSAVRDGIEATRKAIEASRSAAEQANIEAKNNIEVARTVRERTQEKLKEALLDAEIAQRFAGAGDAGLAIAAQMRERVAELKGRIAEGDAALVALERRRQQTLVDLAQEEAKRLADPAERIKKIYDDRAAAVANAVRAEIAAGKELTLARAHQLAQDLAGIEREQQARLKLEADKARVHGDGVARFRSREQAIGIAGRELQGAGFRVDGNVQFGVTGGHANNRAHNLYAADVNVGKGVTEANIPNLKEQFDALALAYQARGYEVIWNGQFYPAGGHGASHGAKGHMDHLHIQAPATIVGKGTGAATVHDQLAQFRDATRAAVREATDEEITEAQTANLFALAKAYESSGGAALIAAARVKAETDAIRQKGDVEKSVARDVALAIAQRVADAAKATATMRDQADAQAEVNRMVAAGLVPADRAGELVQDQLADLPLLAAIQAATATKNVDGTARATAALEAQRAARKRLTDEERRAQFFAAFAAGEDRLAELREELRLVGATDAARTRALVVLRATQEAARQQYNPTQAAAYVEQQVKIADLTQQIADAQRNYNDELSFTADRWNLIAQNVQSAGQGMAEAFGSAGRAIGDMAGIYADYRAQEARALQAHKAAMDAARSDDARQRENAKYALATSTAQVGAFGDMAAAAKGFFKEKSAGYKAVEIAEKAFRAVEFAMSVRSMVQDVAETISSVANSGARSVAAGTEGIANQSKLPFPFNLAAMAATAAALVAAGVAVLGSGGSGGKPPVTNEGKGTIFGDPEAQSESIKRAIDALKEVDTLTNTYARQMAGSLRSIENQIGGIASLVVRAGDISASAGVAEGFKKNMIGSVFGILGNVFGGLFGTKTTVLGSGLTAGPQSLESIFGNGFEAQYYSDVQKKKKLFGITTSNKTSTQFSAADGTLESQFAMLLQSFNNAIVAAAGPLGAATADIQNRLNSFVVNLGKIELKGLTGAEIEEKLSAVFGAAADNMASAAFPGMEQFQQIGEGAFETLVRVASTVEAVTNTLGQLGAAVQGLGIDAKMGLAGQFESLGAFTDAADRYFEGFYTKEEQAAAKAAQLARVFDSLGLAMPATIAAYRALVDAQDLATGAGQEAYATLLQLAPAFADVQAAMAGAKSAADVLSERADLERRLLELQGDTAAIRALDLAKLDASNRALQQQVWAVQDAQEAAKAADELRKAWTGVGDSIMDEVRRIRGIADPAGPGGFAGLMGQFNAMTAAARGGDMDAAKALPQLSQALLTAATNAAASRQELDRVRAQTAASLEATHRLVSMLGANPATSDAALLSASAPAGGGTAANDNGNASLAARLDDLIEKVEQMRSEMAAGNSAIASGVNKTARILDNVTHESGGDAVRVAV
jgi:hypothetical protein